MDSAERAALMLALGYGDIHTALYAGSDGSGETYAGGGLKYSLGALSFSVDGSMAESDDVINGELGFAGKELDMYAGAAYTIAPCLVFNASYGIEGFFGQRFYRWCRWRGQQHRRTRRDKL